MEPGSQNGLESEDDPELLKIGKNNVSCIEEDALIHAFKATGMDSDAPRFETDLRPEAECALARAVCASLPCDYGLSGARPKTIDEIPHLLFRAIEKRMQRPSNPQKRAVLLRTQAPKNIQPHIRKKDRAARKDQKAKLVSFSATPQCSPSSNRLVCTILKPKPQMVVAGGQGGMPDIT